MFLKDKHSGDLVEILDVDALCDPYEPSVRGRYHSGEEMPDPADFRKTGLIFPSGESLPRCWFEPHYKDNVTRRRTHDTSVA